MKYHTKNEYILKFQEALEDSNGNREEMLQAIDRIKGFLASMILGRDFGEDVEVFLNRKPKFLEFREWTQTIEISPKWELVQY